ncbi:hypothetical protein NDU88_004648 [Pleurodeles waltl]|uniref:Uncharacterized protein n=1 Tax=Pleurodeles waltl TaxID=8319 RepID=A0AAV7V5P0_PLEWA|nr:hypothetical protein NDU88_004648 [Pleurodeles waltl]
MRCGGGEADAQASDARRALSDTETRSSREAWLGGELDRIDIGLAVHQRVRLPRVSIRNRNPADPTRLLWKR